LDIIAGALSANRQQEREATVKIRSVLLSGVLTVLIAFGAFAQVKSKSITFSKDVTVNGVTVKAGKYKAEFDSEKNELSFAKDGKIVAKAPARAETEPTKASGTRIETTHTDNADLLIAITFNGEDQRIVLANGQTGSTK
jgi:anionic cell wall polymer biosynthesis LytR-Cps2A-Psr (LCP) family protein